MSNITLETLEKLSMLSTNSEEKKAITESLEKIVDHLEQLQAIDTEGVEPLISVQLEISKNRMRDDSVKNLLSKDVFLENSPAHIGGMLQVPVVIQKD